MVEATNNQPGHQDYHVDEAEVLGRLVLNATEAARVAGVTVRQLTYWTDKDVIPTVGGDKRSYDIAALRKTVRIRQTMERGFTLEKAVQIVEARLAAEDSRAARTRALGIEDIKASLHDELGRLAESVRRFRGQLPVHVALCQLRRSIATLDRLQIDQEFRGAASASERSLAFARRLRAAAEEIDRALAELAATDQDYGADANGLHDGLVRAAQVEPL